MRHRKHSGLVLLSMLLIASLLSLSVYADEATTQQDEITSYYYNYYYNWYWEYDGDGNVTYENPVYYIPDETPYVAYLAAMTQYAMAQTMLFPSIVAAFGGNVIDQQVYYINDGGFYVAVCLYPGVGLNGPQGIVYEVSNPWVNGVYVGPTVLRTLGELYNINGQYQINVNGINAPLAYYSVGLSLIQAAAMASNYANLLIANGNVAPQDLNFNYYYNYYYYWN